MDRNEFLKSGAIIRFSEDQWCVAWGPAQSLDRARDEEISFYLPEFFSNNKEPWVAFKNNSVLTTLELQQILEKQESSEPRNFKQLAQLASLKTESYLKIADCPWSKASKELFEKDFKEAQELFKSGSLQKIVPLSWELAKWTPTNENLKNMIHRLLSCHSHLYPYGYWSEGEGVLGATPEYLFLKEGLNIKTMSLAGTKLSKDSNSLLEDSKQVQEHNIVTAHLVEQLKAMGEVQTSSTEEWPVGSLTHLKTDLELKLFQPVEFEELVQKLHPTPALGGNPQKKALEVLKQQTSAPLRRRFGAPFGVQWSKEKALSLVAIRNIQWHKNQTLLFAGCGLISESRFEEEWVELENKRLSVKKLLGL